AYILLPFFVDEGLNRWDHAERFLVAGQFRPTDFPVRDPVKELVEFAPEPKHFFKPILWPIDFFHNFLLRRLPPRGQLAFCWQRRVARPCPAGTAGTSQTLLRPCEIRAFRCDNPKDQVAGGPNPLGSTLASDVAPKATSASRSRTAFANSLLRASCLSRIPCTPDPR